jgi:cytochrome P450
MAVFDQSLLTPEFFADPYPVLHQLRAEAQINWSDVMKSWVLTRYSDVTATLRDPKL